MDWRQSNYDPPHGEDDRGRWQVHFAVSPAEREAIARAAPTVVPAESVEIHTELGEAGLEGEVTLALRVFAVSSNEATHTAADVYSRIRQVAGVDADRAPVLGYISPWWHEQSLAAEISKEAHELHRQGRHELAIVRIQTACELRVAEALRRLLRARHSSVDGEKLIRRPANLMDDQARALLHLLTGRRIQTTSWWSQYAGHVRRRNAIVHRGLAVDHDEASDSLKAAIALGEWLLEARADGEQPRDS